MAAVPSYVAERCAGGRVEHRQRRVEAQRHVHAVALATSRRVRSCGPLFSGQRWRVPLGDRPLPEDHAVEGIAGRSGTIAAA